MTFIKLSQDQRVTLGLHNSSFIHSHIVCKNKSIQMYTFSFTFQTFIDEPLSTAFPTPLKVSMVTGSRSRTAVHIM